MIEIPEAPPRPDVPDVTWRWWEAILVVILWLVVSGIVSAPIVAGHEHHLGASRKLVLQVIQELILLGSTFGWLWIGHRRSVQAIGIPEKPGPEIGRGFLGGLALYAGGVFVIGLIVAGILHAVSNRKLHPPHQIPQHLSVGEIALAGITVLIVAPIAEELFFRGFLFRSLRARHSFMFAGVISGLAFGAVHYPGGAWQNALLLPIVMCFVGFGLAWIYEWRGNIVANIAAHATFNVIGFAFIVAMLR